MRRARFLETTGQRCFPANGRARSQPDKELRRAISPLETDDHAEKYRLFQRANGVFYQGNEFGKQRSLQTKERRAAEKLLHVGNEAHRLPTLNLTMARAFLSAYDANMSTTAGTTRSTDNIYIDS